MARRSQTDREAIEGGEDQETDLGTARGDETVGHKTEGKYDKRTPEEMVAGEEIKEQRTPWVIAKGTKWADVEEEEDEELERDVDTLMISSQTAVGRPGEEREMRKVPRWRRGSLRRSWAQGSRRKAAAELQGKSRATKCEWRLQEFKVGRYSTNGDRGGHPKVVSHPVPGVEVRCMQAPSANSCESMDPTKGSAQRHRRECRRIGERLHRCDRDQPISNAEGGALGVGLHDCACSILCLCDAYMRCMCIDGPALHIRNVWAQVYSAL